MSGQSESGRVRPLESIRVHMVEQLRARRPGLEQAIYVAIGNVASDSSKKQDAEYEAGLRAAIAAVVDYCLTGIEHGEEWSGPIPSAAIAQARRAARSGVSQGTVLLRYIVGHKRFGELIMDEANRSGFSSHGPALCDLRRTQESLLERLTTTISDEYKHERVRTTRSPKQRLAERVQKLLAGESVDVSQVDYEFEAWHLGMVATGTRAGKIVRDLAKNLGCQLLLVPRNDESLSAWFGREREFAVTDIERLLLVQAPAGVSLAVGEPGKGVDGWRLTHRQAEEAWWVALRAPQVLTQYANVLLLAAVLRDDMLAESLKEVYLAPLSSQLRETLCAYFENEHNIKAAAAALSVDRSTIRSRLRTVEQRLGRLLHTCQAELAVALRLEEIQGGSSEPLTSRRLA